MDQEEESKMLNGDPPAMKGMDRGKDGWGETIAVFVLIALMLGLLASLFMFYSDAGFDVAGMAMWQGGM